MLKYNGGSAGYKSVSESHTGGTSTLICEDPGDQSCEFLINPIHNLEILDAFRIAEQNINEGNHVGEIENNGKKLEWNGSDIYNYEVYIHDVGEGF